MPKALGNCATWGDAGLPCVSGTGSRCTAAASSAPVFPSKSFLVLSYLSDPQFLLVASAILLLGGGIKGVIGLGLPLVSVPLLAYLLPVPVAISVLAAPVMVSNSYQALRGGLLGPVLARIWPLLVAMVVGVLLGAQLLITLNEKVLYLILGAMVVILGLVYLFGANLTLNPRYERKAGVTIGFGAGLLGGVSSFLGPPIVLYLVALQLAKEHFIVALASVFFIASLPLYGTLALSGIMGGEEFLLSLYAIVPVMLGVFAGQQLRRVLPQERFRQAVLIMLVLIGLLLIRRGLLF